MKKKTLQFSLLVIFFLFSEFISYLFLKNIYKNYGMPSFEKFKLFSQKDKYHDPLQLSVFYNFRFKDNLYKSNNNFPKTVAKGLLDEYFIENDNYHPISEDNKSFDIYLFGGSTIFLTGDYSSIGKYINYHLKENQKNLWYL